MIDPSLELQAAIRDRLIADPRVLEHVAPARIRDGGGKPDAFPLVTFGPSQIVEADITLKRRRHVRASQQLDVWTKEIGHVAAKTIAAAIVSALAVAPAMAGLIAFQVDGVRYLRDPGDLGHAVISISALLEIIE